MPYSGGVATLTSPSYKMTTTSKSYSSSSQLTTSSDRQYYPDTYRYSRSTTVDTYKPRLSAIEARFRSRETISSYTPSRTYRTSSDIASLSSVQDRMKNFKITSSASLYQPSSSSSSSSLSLPRRHSSLTSSLSSTSSSAGVGEVTETPKQSVEELRRMFDSSVNLNNPAGANTHPNTTTTIPEPLRASTPEGTRGGARATNTTRSDGSPSPDRDSVSNCLHGLFTDVETR